MGVVFAFFFQISPEGVHQVGVAGAVAVAEKMGGLIEDGDVLILPNHLDLGLPLFGGSLLGLGREELIVDIQFQQVPLMDTVVRVLLFSVYLDPLVPEGFIQQAFGHIMGDPFHKPGKAYSLFVGTGHKIFHSPDHITFL